MSQRGRGEAVRGRADAPSPPGADGLPHSPLQDNANLSRRYVAREIADGVHLVVNAGSLFWEDGTALRDIALRNGTGGTVATWVDPSPGPTSLAE